MNIKHKKENFRDLDILDSPTDVEFFLNFVKQRQESVGII